MFLLTVKVTLMLYIHVTGVRYDCVCSQGFMGVGTGIPPPPQIVAL